MSLQKETRKQISEKSTKQDLWQAYNELIQKVSEEPVKIQLEQKETAPSDSLRNLAELKLKISQQLDQTGEELLKNLNVLDETKNIMTKEKRRIIEYFEEQKKTIENEIEHVREQWEKEKKLHKDQIEEENHQRQQENEREEDEYNYHLSIERRKENDEITRTRAEQEAKLKTREESLAAKEQEMSKKEMKVAQEVNSAKTILTQELTAKHNLELREAKLDFERDKKIYELKIANLETQIKSQIEEIVKLERRLSQAAEQTKEIVVSAIKGHSLKTPEEELE